MFAISGKSWDTSAMNSPVPARTLGVLAVIGLLSTAGLPAQDAPEAEIAALRKVVEEQGRQIEALSSQVAQLVARLQATAPSPPSTEPATASPGGLVATPIPVQPEPNFHVVEKGDSLEKIAKTCGTTTVELQKLNSISDPNKLRIGQKILLPAGLAPKEAP